MCFVIVLFVCLFFFGIHLLFLFCFFGVVDSFLVSWVITLVFMLSFLRSLDLLGLEIV